MESVEQGEEGEEGQEVEGVGVETALVAGGGLEELSEVGPPLKRSRAQEEELQELAGGGGSLGTVESLPSKVRGGRACLVCGLVKTQEQFEERGCDNCERYVSMHSDRERVLAATTSRFQGLLGMADPTRSWVARFQRMQPSWVPGTYAVQTKGALPQDVAELLDDRGCPYIPRERVQDK